ncbi:abortive infection family protein [Tabrizicola sp.]|uniref:abortive infection family protein n=1 Tax=Tabrizicola sp. TaxID=2005166 RepID=UPI0035AEEEA5
MDRIPTSLIGLLSQIFPDRYTQAEIDSLFLFAGAPEPIPDGSKATKVQAWLRQINARADQPTRVLGIILDDFMERPAPPSTFWLSTSEDHAAKLELEKAKIRETLAREGVAYVRGGNFVRAGATATISLVDAVKKNGLATVDVEIQRALAQIETDPQAAAHYAGNVLEAALKAYLDHKGRAYASGDALAELWKAAADQIGLRPVDWDSKDLKKIASGLNSIVDGIMHLRNTKSGAHGKSEEQARAYSIKPRHARLAIHASHTVAAYVLELIE